MAKRGSQCLDAARIPQNLPREESGIRGLHRIAVDRRLSIGIRSSCSRTTSSLPQINDADGSMKFAHTTRDASAMHSALSVSKPQLKVMVCFLPSVFSLCKRSTFRKLYESSQHRAPFCSARIFSWVRHLSKPPPDSYIPVAGSILDTSRISIRGSDLDKFPSFRK